MVAMKKKKKNTKTKTCERELGGFGFESERALDPIFEFFQDPNRSRENGKFYYFEAKKRKEKYIIKMKTKK